MSTTGLPVFDSTIEKTNTWLHDLEQTIGAPDRHRAYIGLRAVLHALRDRLSPDEAAQLAAPLPMLIRGLYYEGWHPAHKPRKYRHKRDFLDQIAQEAPALDPTTLEEMVTAVFELLTSELGTDVADQVRALLPPELRELWPQPGL